MQTHEQHGWPVFWIVVALLAVSSAFNFLNGAFDLNSLHSHFCSR
jgi:hypothetical protein